MMTRAPPSFNNTDVCVYTRRRVAQSVGGARERFNTGLSTLRHYLDCTFSGRLKLARGVAARGTFTQSSAALLPTLKIESVIII